jgi:hypothetical protein
MIGPAPLLILALAGAGSSEAPAGQAPLSLTLRPAAARVGEWIEVEVAGRLPPGTTRVEPLLPDALGGLEVLESGHLAAPDGTLRWRLRLVAFDPGRRIVPPLVFRCWRGAATEDLSTARTDVEILDLTLAPGAELRSSRPPVALPLTSGERLAALAAAGALLLGLRRLRRRVRGPSPLEGVPVPPPRERALSALRALEREIPVPPPSTGEFYGRLVEVMRGFLTAAEGVAAFHMTSRQILESTGSRAPSARRALGEVLSAADEVRFGGGLPEGTAQIRHLEAAKDTVGSWSAARDEGRR